MRDKNVTEYFLKAFRQIMDERVQLELGESETSYLLIGYCYDESDNNLSYVLKLEHNGLFYELHYMASFAKLHPAIDFKKVLQDSGDFVFFTIKELGGEFSILMETELKFTEDSLPTTYLLENIHFAFSGLCSQDSKIKRINKWMGV